MYISISVHTLPAVIRNNSVFFNIDYVRFFRILTVNLNTYLRITNGLNFITETNCVFADFENCFVCVY